jgi:hypothetical protein
VFLTLGAPKWDVENYATNMVSLIVLERLSNTIRTHRTLMKDFCNSNSNSNTNGFGDMSFILDNVREEIYQKMSIMQLAMS